MPLGEHSAGGVEMTFDDLDPETKEFLAELDKEKLAELQELLRTFRSTKTVSRFVKWSVVTVVACFLTASALGDAINKILSWFSSMGVHK